MEARDDTRRVEHFVPEKSERLLVEGVPYGEFSFVTFILPETKDVRNYADPKHPIMLTLNGQNHGEMTRTVLVNANLPELSSSMIVEVRVDNLEQEALSHIISNSREFPKPSAFTRSLTDRLIQLLHEDESLQELERRRQERRAAESNKELNARLSQFLSQILSDAASRPIARTGKGSPGTGTTGNGVRPEIPAHDPPYILEFISRGILLVPEGATYSAKFKSDARPPKYAFHGDNPRLFGRFEPQDKQASRISIVGKSEINSRGYGSISLHCTEDPASPVLEPLSAGQLALTLQSTDGRLLTAMLEVAVGPKPEPRERARERDVQIEVRFCSPGGDPEKRYATLVAEESVGDFGTYLQKFRDALGIPDTQCAYWGEKYEKKDGATVLGVEINVANPSLLGLLEGCKSAEERVVAKETYCRDVILDCYQHCFRLDDVPDPIQEIILGQEEEAKKAAEMFLNHDKAVRFANHERDNNRRQR